SPSVSTSRPRASSPLCPYTTLFRSEPPANIHTVVIGWGSPACPAPYTVEAPSVRRGPAAGGAVTHPAPIGERTPGRGDAHPEVRSEEHTSELQARFDLVCRPLLEKH